MGPNAMILVFIMLSFKTAFPLSSFTFIKRLFSSSSLSALSVVSSVYLRLLIFLLAILIPTCASSRPTFLMMFSACKLNSQAGWQYMALMYSFPNLEPVLSYMSDSNCCFLTSIQVSEEPSKVVWYSHLFKNVPQFVVIHRVKVFSIVNEAEEDAFLEFSFILWSNRYW